MTDSSQPMKESALVKCPCCGQFAFKAWLQHQGEQVPVGWKLTDEMVETAASAVYAKDTPSWERSWEDAAQSLRERYLADARAALEAVRAMLSSAPASPEVQEETDDELDERLQKQEARDNLRLLDWIADKIGLPKEEELSRENFAAWLTASPASPVRERGDRIAELERALVLTMNWLPSVEVKKEHQETWHNDLNVIVAALPPRVRALKDSHHD